jgi:hypothetical protein
MSQQMMQQQMMQSSTLQTLDDLATTSSWSYWYDQSGY